MLPSCPLKLVWSSPTDHQFVEKKNGAHPSVRPHGLLESLPKVCLNLGSLSDTMDTGTPYTRIISRIYNFQNFSCVKVIRTSRKCANLVSWSTITYTVSCLRCVCGKWITKSIAICSHFHSATSNGWSSCDASISGVPLTTRQPAENLYLMS